MKKLYGIYTMRVSGEWVLKTLCTSEHFAITLLDELNQKSMSIGLYRYEEMGAIDSVADINKFVKEYFG